ncbi:MAG: hypothetical protein Q4A06_00090 [Cardiobacteriaceae bacterium]|nr:hypothetical protein [Cardiobacteriaceae bacterium]
MPNIEIVQLLAAREAQVRLQFRTREGLERHQHRQMLRLVKQVLPQSPYYNLLLSRPLAEWPVMNARLLGEYFDIINTLGLKKAEVADLLATQEGQVLPGIGSCCPLLSRHGNTLFLLNTEERLCRLGTLLAGLGNDARNIAYFFHADYLLGGDIRHEDLRIESYDLSHSYASLRERLLLQQPDTVIAPCALLLRLHDDIRDGTLQIGLPNVYNCGEVLTQRDRLKLRTLFPCVGDIYLTAEAFVGMTCGHGRLHLNETNLLVQYENLEGNRCLPLITDLHAQSLPLVQYRLNDVLVLDPLPCPCGCVHQVVRHVEGSLQDVLLLPGASRRSVRIYPEVCHGILLRNLPKDCDYQLVQQGACQIELRAAAEEEALHHARHALLLAWRQAGVDTARLAFHARQTWGEHDLGQKRRQVMRVA